MRLVPDGSSWRVEGPDSDRARVTYARLRDGRVVYELPQDGGRALAPTFLGMEVDPSGSMYTRDTRLRPRPPDRLALGRLAESPPRASVFHSRGWLEALKRTYGYEPIVLTTTPDGPLSNGLVLCRVKTWLSRRLVSLPFSDHCDPLLNGATIWRS